MGEESSRKEKMGKLVETYFNDNKEPLLNYILASCISADTTTTITNCDASIETLEYFKMGFEVANIPEETKMEYLEIIESGLEICNRDKNQLLSEKATEEN